MAPSIMPGAPGDVVLQANLQSQVTHEVYHQFRNRIEQGLSFTHDLLAITCKKPMITNGRVENPKEIYNEGEKLPFKCNKKYKPYRSEDVICNANGWSPEPLCEDVSCYPDYVANGKVEKTKEIYKEGDTMVLNCNYGYQIEFSPNEPRKCTANGWFPPLKCISQTCIRPEIADGQLYYYYYFPKQLGTYIDYRCNYGFLPQGRNYYGRSFCTENGWNPKPKCTKTCSRYNAQVENGELQNSDDYYLVGEKVQFSCRQSYLTKDKQKNGERECLPNGKFTEDQCSKFCDVTQLPVGKYEPDKKIFVVGETLLFECNNGFVIARGKISTNIECLQTGWSTFPQCFDAKCVVKGNNLISQRRDYKIGEVAQISCPPDYTLKGSELIQCYNYGWGPELPKCEEAKCVVKGNNLISQRRDYKIGEVAQISCPPDYTLKGSELIQCYNYGWGPELPKCE
ncbi:complement factor H-like, partial [Pelobates fuscus]|uniref:complement factor H-like n=1 Tax=Pelobates fuscus TaxID=191477 RepID=UPI002FE48BE2